MDVVVCISHWDACNGGNPENMSCKRSEAKGRKTKPTPKHPKNKNKKVFGWKISSSWRWISSSYYTGHVLGSIHGTNESHDDSQKKIEMSL